jgi:chromosome segregation ATPase
MNEDTTKDLAGPRSFEERVFARFDAVDVRFDFVDARFEAVDARLETLESRGFDTKPIWQNALKAIMEMGLEVSQVKSRVAVLETDLGVVMTDVAAMRIDYVGIRSDLTDMKREKHHINKRLDLILEFLLAYQQDIRDATERIKQLETKLA